MVVGGLLHTQNFIEEDLWLKDFSYGYSVRCIRGNQDIIMPTASEKPDNAFTDPRDKKQYKTVKIGKLEWMAENLNHDIKGWQSWCYGDESFNCKNYGRLYDWNAATKACPSGWRLPGKGEWNDLIRAVDDMDEKTESEEDLLTEVIGSTVEMVASAASAKTLFGGGGLKNSAKDFIKGVVKYDKTASDRSSAVNGNIVAGKKLKSKKFKGTDDFGFSALLGGNRNNKDGFNNINKSEVWWTKAENKENNNEAYSIFVIYDSDNVKGGNFSKSDGYSVRCVKDSK